MKRKDALRLQLTSGVLDTNGPSTNDDDGVLGVLKSLLSVDEGLLRVEEGGSESPHREVVCRSKSKDGNLKKTKGTKYYETCDCAVGLQGEERERTSKSIV
jgi:hypothetical protein